MWPKNDFYVFGVEEAYQMNTLPASGVRFRADGYFEGENQSNNAEIKVWIKNPKIETDDADQKPAESEVDESKDENWKEIQVMVLNMEADTLYTYTQEVDTGLQVVPWYLNEKGVKYPSRKKVKPDAKDSWGPKVVPGKYKLVLSYGTYSDSIFIEVKPDPRIAFNLEGILANRRLWNQHKKTIKLARLAMERLIDAQQTIHRVNVQFELEEDTIQEAIKTLGKEINDTIVKIQEVFMQAKDLSGYQDNSRKLNTYLYSASSHIMSLKGEPTTTAEFAVRTARIKTDSVVEIINSLFSTVWAEYQDEVAKYTPKLFNQFKELKRD